MNENSGRLEDGLRLSQRQTAEILTVLETFMARGPVGFVDDEIIGIGIVDVDITALEQVAERRTGAHIIQQAVEMSSGISPIGLLAGEEWPRREGRDGMMHSWW
jgi:hypothetical protein